ncbi:hypothetical protein VTJ04DRAFT_1368 [Mycothermus thermophilus]|uniref:uncharacterized protein n=1 Tax=Humicola insolens TaxID=85995 RepID=UPI00374451BF
MSNTEGHDLPIPTAERNEGSDLQVYYCQDHHHQHGEYPWRKAPGTTPEAIPEAGWYPLNDRQNGEAMTEAEKPQRRCLGIQTPVFVLSCLLFVIIVALVTVLATAQPSSDPIAYPLVPVTNARYVGCYWYSINLVLVDMGRDQQNMTNELCSTRCRERAPHIRAFGTKDGFVCYCVTLSETAQRAPEWQCNARCEGTKGKQPEYCGGGWALSIWERTDM